MKTVRNAAVIPLFFTSQYMWIKTSIDTVLISMYPEQALGSVSRVTGLTADKEIR